MKVSIKAVVFGLLVFAASSVFAQTNLTFTGGGNNATFGGSGAMLDATADATAIGNDGLLAGAGTFDLTVTTQSDILLFDAEITQTAGVNVAGGWYNNATGDDVNPPNPAFVGVFPELGFDSWVTTPGATAAAGANKLDNPAGTNMVTHNDSTDEGAQTDFTFAKITLIPDEKGNASAVFRGTLQTSADPTPVFDNFEYTLSIGVPEPASMGLVLTALLGGLSIIRRKRNS